MLDLLARSHRQLGWVVVCLVFTSGSLQAEPPRLAVSSFALDTLTLTPPTAQEIVASLTGETWCSAVAVDSKHPWNQVPPGVERSQWVSLVTVGFKGQAEVYAFMFDGPNGAISMVTHVPFREVWLAAGSAAWVWPTDSVLGALRVRYRDRTRQPARKLLKLVVVPWVDSEGDAFSTKKTPNLTDAQTLAPELVYPQVTVMAHAAAFEAGWTPTTADVSWSATCEIRAEDQACSFRLTLRADQMNRTVTKLHVPWETYHEHLVRLFNIVDSNRGVSDYSQLTRHRLELLAVSEGKLACLLNHELSVFDVTTGKKAWTTEPTIKPANYQPTPQYKVESFTLWDQKRQPAPPRLLRFRPSLAELAWETGKVQQVLATTGVDFSHRCNTGTANVCVTAKGGQISLSRSGTPAWEFQEADPISAGPQLIGDLVFYGQASGRMTARAARNGEVLWQKQLSAGLYGQIVSLNSNILAFSNASESMIAVDAARGTILWKSPVGDVLLETPHVIEKRILIVTKGNRLLQLDTESGQVTQEIQWPTWVVSARLLDVPPVPLIACADLEGNVTLLSLTDLRPIRLFATGAPLIGPILYVPQMSHTWATPKSAESEENLLAEIEDGPMRTGPCLLAADSLGFIYILPLPSSE